MTGDQVSVEVYDKAWRRIGFVNAPVSLEATWRLNAPSTATITIPASSPKSGLLMAEGNRVRILARGLTWSGWLHKWTLDGIGPDAVVTAAFASYLTWLEQVVCWPITGTLPGTLTREYDSRSGVAETVFKGYLQSAAARLSLPWEFAPDQLRGSTIKERLRMHTPADKLLPLLEPAGLRATMIHHGGPHVTVDVEALRTYPRTITASSGILGADTSVTVTGPTVSRVVTGGAGEAAARIFGSMVWSEVEDAWGRIAEKFVDARDIQLSVDDPLMDTQAEVDAAYEDRATRELDDGNAQVAVSATLSETAWFRVEAGVLEVGDRVPLSISIPTANPAAPLTIALTETITEATLRWTPEDGVTVAPKLGRMIDDPQGPLLTRVAQLSSRLRQIATRN